MREYRFRGKDKNTGKWVYGFYLEQDTYSMGSKNTKKDLLIKDAGVIVQNSKYDSGTVIDKETLGQYTGLKDKNEKEIYEGDILELNKDGRIFYGTSDGLLAKKYQLVGFKDGAFMTCRNKHLIDDYDTYLWIISKYSTVAGNIYDNPEFLEEGD